jgi:hypothetical protein
MLQLSKGGRLCQQDLDPEIRDGWAFTAMRGCDARLRREVRGRVLMKGGPGQSKNEYRLTN